MKQVFLFFLLIVGAHCFGQTPKSAETQKLSVFQKADHSTIHYNQQPTLELVWVNGKQRYVETWDYVPAQYITYSTAAKTEAATGNTIGDTLVGDVVTRVHDGDSYYLKGMRDFVRIAGIDAPEIFWTNGTKDQAFGRAAGDSVRLALKGKSITYDFLGMDQYGRPLVSIFVNGQDFAEYMLLRGLAWAYGTRKLPSVVNKRYRDAQEQAKKAKVGLWAEKSPVKPWVHRAENPPIKKR
jgi:micrococcal nuclease